MTDKVKNAMQQLASSTYWDIVRDEFIIPEMQKINNVYNDLDLAENERDFKAKYLAKQIAFGKIEMIISKIDSYCKKTKDLKISYE